MTKQSVTTRVLPRREIEALLDEIAQLRIDVFRAWPYLYDGDLAYERDYLKVYLDSPRAIVVGAFDQDRLVGVSTGSPILDHSEEFQTPLKEAGIDLNRLFYCAESVLLPQYRGHGVGHAFFDHRESHALKHGFESVCFCAVVRAKTHSLCPENYKPLDPFWTARGYAPLEGIAARFSWRDIGEDCETEKELGFWFRSLRQS